MNCQKYRCWMIVPALCFAAMQMAAAAPVPPDATFSISASAADFGNYFPSYLANGYFSTMTAPRGTEGNLAYMVGLDRRAHV